MAPGASAEALAWKGVPDAFNHAFCIALVVQAFAGALSEACRPVQAVALLVAFAAMLRPIELARLIVRMASFPRSSGPRLPQGLLWPGDRRSSGDPFGGLAVCLGRRRLIELRQ